MKPIPIKVFRCHVGITMPGTTSNTIDNYDKVKAKIFMMPWGFDFFFKSKKFGVAFSNVTAWEYDLDYEGPSYEQCNELCKPSPDRGKQALSKAV